MSNEFSALEWRAPQPGPLTVFRHEAMASDFEVALNESQDEQGADAALDALDEVDRVEEELSVFRPNSAVSRINLLAGEIPVKVDRELWDWLELSIRLGKDTDGAFDIASAPLWRAWGFADRDGEFPPEDKLKRAIELSGAKNVRMDELAQTVAFEQNGVELNFGAIGKGLALDCAAKKLEERGVFNYLIQGGKSGAIARGGRLNDYSPDDLDKTIVKKNVDDEFDEESGLRKRTIPPTNGNEIQELLPEALRTDESLAVAAKLQDCATGWSIGVAHPLAPEKRLGRLWLHDCALATSGTTYQFFRAGGKRYSHIIDPRTGYPTLGMLATTILAPTAAEADALSTAFFVLGPEKTREFCERRPDVGALLIVECEIEPGYKILTFNIDSNVFRPC